MVIIFTVSFAISMGIYMFTMDSDFLLFAIIFMGFLILNEVRKNRT